MGAARKLFVAGDLFCGGGGFSKGFALACRDLGIKDVRLIAINHSLAAIEAHKRVAPWAEHHCARVDQLDPRKLVPEGRMKILIASPECTNHANARGGRPINDQSRATAWDVVKWAQELYIENILIENVREIMEWGPLGANGRPLKSKKGEIFRAWTEAIRKCGYDLDYRVLNAADFGGATTRQRFFLIARRRGRIHWPEPTHAKDADKTGDLFRGLKPWRGAREIIDWNLKGRSIFNRKQPLAKNTIARIEAGLRKFGGAAAEPFLIILKGRSGAASVDQPLPTITAQNRHLAVCEPFILGQHGERRLRSIEQPIPTVTTVSRIGLVEPFVLQQQSGGAPRSTREPLPAIAGKGAQALVQPFIVPFFGEREGQKPRTHSVEEPLPAVTSHGAGALVEPFVIQANHGTNGKRNDSGRVRSVREPLSTITTGGRSHALVEPFLVQYNGMSKAHHVDSPVAAITAKDRHGLVEPKAEPAPGGVAIDILFRMLEPHELERAMGFDGNEFTGTKKHRVLMIGNAVEVNTAKALVRAVLE